MFYDMAMYTYIIVHSVINTKWFLGMTAIIILGFGSAAFVLDRTQKQMYRGIDQEVTIWYDKEMDFEYEPLASDRSRSTLFDSIFTQYLLMLGEFEWLELDQISSYNRTT